MADQAWEDYVEPAMDASVWVLERLYDTFVTLDVNDRSENDEFREAASGVLQLIKKLQDVRNECFNQRSGFIKKE